MNDTMIPYKRSPDMHSQTLIVDNASVVVSFSATQQENDRHILDEVARILFDSYHANVYHPHPCNFQQSSG